jgi:hypothetical protein
MRLPFTASLVALLIATRYADAAFTFSPGHYYSSTGSSLITQYDPTGAIVGSLDLGPREVKGLAFGPDGLLYATTLPETSGFEVLAIDNAGVVRGAYGLDFIHIGGNVASGKIAVDNASIYVAGGNVLTKFDLGNPDSGTVIYSANQVFDVEILPTGNLLVASAYEVRELSPSGSVVRDIAGGTDVRGVEYDPATNNMFVTHLGHTGFFFQLTRFDWLTGALEESTTFTYANDLFVTAAGEVLVGSWTESPRLYSQELDLLGELAGPEQLFVTQYAVPEPCSGLLMLAMALVGASVRRGINA